MAAIPSPDDTSHLIAGVYSVDVARPLPGAGGGLPAFAATDRSAGRSGLMAVQSTPGGPPRAMALNALTGWTQDGLLVPLAHGPATGPRGEAAWFVVSAAPPGPSLAASLRPWGEAELLEYVLRPAAAVLVALDQQRVTHRAIRVDNIFRAGMSASVVLGAAWSAPPAQHQPALFEPPYSAMCLPGGRGDGTIADDVYALGVTLVVLALGRLPLEGLDPVTILRRKLALGSYAALVGEERLPPTIGDLVRGMLAEDPEHRPPPVLLADPAAARTRRVAARPPRRGQHPLELAGERVWDARTLAHAVATNPDEGGRLLRSGAVDRWLRRSLGDPVMAARLDEVARLHSADAAADSARADALVTMCAVAVLDPLAPLCWRGVALWPDGLGPVLASADAMHDETGDLLAERLADMVTSEATGHWALMRPERGDVVAMRMAARQRRVMMHLRGWGGGLSRLRYVLNPLLACSSPILAGHMVARLGDLLAALEAAAGRPELRRGQPVDREITAFVAARNEQRFEAEMVGMADAVSPDGAVVMQLRMLAGLQRRAEGKALPQLAAWLAEQAAPSLASWRNRPRREAIERALAEVARSGQLMPMVGLLDNAAARAADLRGFKAANDAVQRIDAELAALAGATAMRAEAARRIGHEVALGIAMVALTVAVVAAVLA
jgi:hypothetical protein